MRSPLGARGALLADFGIGSMAAALTGRPRRHRRANAPGAWPPAGVDLVLDFENARHWVFGRGAVHPAALFSRASSAWAFDATGQLVLFGTNAIRIVPSPNGVMSFLREVASTNKCTNHNAVPNGSLTNLTKAGDAAATLTEVADATEMAAAGLTGICTGNVFKLDNSAGAATATATAGGTTGNTNVHNVSAYMRGSGNADVHLSGAAASTSALTAAYVRRARTQTPAGSSEQLVVTAAAGAIVYFILNQLEEQPVSTTPIVVTGAQVTRAADLFILPFQFDGTGTLWADYVQAYASSVGAASSIIAILDGGSSANQVALYRTASGFFSFSVRAAGNTEMAGNFAGVAANVRIRQAIRVRLNDGLGVANGTTVSDNAVALPTGITTLRLGHAATATSEPAQQVYIHAVRVYRGNLTDTQLRAIAP